MKSTEEKNQTSISAEDRFSCKWERKHPAPGRPDLIKRSSRVKVLPSGCPPSPRGWLSCRQFAHVAVWVRGADASAGLAESGPAQGRLSPGLLALQLTQTVHTGPICTSCSRPLHQGLRPAPRQDRDPPALSRSFPTTVPIQSQKPHPADLRRSSSSPCLPPQASAAPGPTQSESSCQGEKLSHI